MKKQKLNQYSNLLTDNREEIPKILFEYDTKLEHMCRLDLQSMPTNRQLTGLICSISESSRRPETITKMLEAGMTIARLNCSHDTHEHHSKTIQMLREAVEAYSETIGYEYNLAIAIDLKGPEIRTGSIDKADHVLLKPDDSVRLTINRDFAQKSNKDVVFVDYPNIINIVPQEAQVFLSDGDIMLIVREIGVDSLYCSVEVGGKLGSKKNVRVPSVHVPLPIVSEKDSYDLKFAVSQKVDFVFASVHNAADVNTIRRTMGRKGKDIKLVAKIETVEAVQNLNEIMAVADAIIVARLDLGVEVPAPKLLLLQKAICARCNRIGKPVIIASQLLQSMQRKGKAYRTEIFDMSNAVLDGADCLMLSSETGIGPHPVKCVRMAIETCRQVEMGLWHRNLFQDLIARNPGAVDCAHAVAISAIEAAKNSMATAIVVLTASGKSAHLISRYRPRCPILAVTRCSKAARQCNIRFGIIPIYYNDPKLSEEEEVKLANPEENANEENTNEADVHENRTNITERDDSKEKEQKEDETPNKIKKAEKKKPIVKDWLEEVENRVQYALFVGKKMEIVNDGDAVVVLSPWKEGNGFTNNMRVLYAFFEREPLPCLLEEEKTNVCEDL